LGTYFSRVARMVNENGGKIWLRDDESVMRT